MIAVDTNVLVCAQMAESRHHRAASDLLKGLAGGAAPWGVPFSCLGEFVRVVTHPRLWSVATPAAVALDNLEQLLRAPGVQVLGPTTLHLATLRTVLAESGVVGARVHDAVVFALCLQHGVRELLTADRDFRVFSGLTITHPFA